MGRLTDGLHDVSGDQFPKVAVPERCGLDSDDFELGIDFLFEHAFDRHQRSGQ